MAATGFFRTTGGWVIELSLPLSDDMQSQATRHQLHRVANMKGDPYDEPAEQTTGDGLKRPPVNASKDEWVGYAVSQGASVDDADAMTKADLIEKYGK